uniref:Endothelin-1 n=4 Tax=Fundulus heteroclitus TaxID=8078 RepID=A0A3Q2UGS0_FUNHE
MWSHSNRTSDGFISIFSPLKDYFCSDFTEMDLKARISVLSLTLSWILCTALSAPAAEPLSASAAAVAPQRHVRNKRCSCATFLDKECVYFCHLDIIWVNTPERVVSYGLGNAPRAKRALSDSMATARAPRCRCLRENDSSCVDFCLRSETAAGARIRSPGHTRSEDTGGPDRTEGTSTTNRARPAALRAVLRTRLQLEKWAARRHHRARAWQGESRAS